jgi:multidrug efflux pump subunit AcrA (membrane-fusion protein)
VTYTDDTAVRGSTIANGNVTVSGPNGFLQSATLVSVDAPGDGAVRTATYQVTAPNGTWAFADGGTYTVTMQTGSVTDTSGNAVAAGTLSSFNVTIAPPATTLGPLLLRKRIATAIWALPGDQNMYAFTINTPAIVTVSLGNVRDPIALQLFDANSTPLLTRTARVISGSVTLSPGTYYLQATVGGKFKTHYTVAATARPVPVPRKPKPKLAPKIASR